MDWAAVDNTIFLAKLFSPLPSLEAVYVHEINIHQDGPSAKIRFDVLGNVPRMPEKWAGLNTVQITLDIFPLLKFSVTDFSRQNICTVGMSRGPSSMRTQISGDATAEFISKFVRVADISAYLK